MLTFVAAVLLDVSLSIALPQAFADAPPAGAIVRIGGKGFHHFDAIQWLGYAPDGKTVITASGDKLRLWNAATGQLSASIPSYVRPRYNFAMSADRRRLAAFRADDAMRIVDVDSRKVIRRLSNDDLLGPEGDRFYAHRIILSPNGRFLAITDHLLRNVTVDEETMKRRRFSVDVWDLDEGRRVQSWKVGDLDDVEFTPDGRTLVAQERGKENILRSYEINSGKERPAVELPLAVSRLVFLSNTRFVGSSMAHDSLHEFDRLTGKKLRVIVEKGKPIVTFAVDPSSERLAYVRDGRLIVRALADGKVLLDQSGFGPWSHVAFSPDGKQIAAANGRRVEMWNLATRTRMHADDTLGGAVLAVHAHGDHLLVRDMDMNLTLWDHRTGQLVRRFVKPPAQRSSAGESDAYSMPLHVFDCCRNLQAISPDGTKVAAVWLDGPIHLYDLVDGKHIRAFERSHRALCLAFSPNGKLLAGPTRDGMMGLWNTTDGKPVLDLAPLPITRERDLGSFLAVAFSPDGRTLSASEWRDEASFQLTWELATGGLRSSLKSSSRWPRSGSNPGGLEMLERIDNLAITLMNAPDGKSRAAAGLRSIRLLDLATGKEIRRFGGRDIVGHSAAFSPDGSLLAVGLENGGIRFWDLATGTVLRDAPAHDLAVTSLAFTDRDTLVSGSLDGTAVAWKVDHLLKAAPADDAEFDKLWTMLGHPDADKVAHAIQAFSDQPGKAVAFFKQRLRPVPVVDAKHIDKLVADLHSNQYAVRARAYVDLEMLEGHARSALEKALRAGQAIEPRRRIETLLRKLEPPLAAPDILRGIRAIEVLERIATPEARSLLETLAGGGRGHRLTEDSREALARLVPTKMSQLNP